MSGASNDSAAPSGASRSGLLGSAPSVEFHTTLSSLCAAGLASCCLGGLQGKFPGLGTTAAAIRQGAGRGACSEAEFKRRIEFLSEVALFKRLPMSHYPILAKELRGVRWEAGHVVLECGQQLTEFALVAEGFAEVQVPGPDGVFSLGQLLWPGDYFGEKVLHTGGGVVVRSPARVVAGPDLVTLSMSAREFEDFGLRQHLAFPKRRALSRCVLQNAKVGDPVAKDENQLKFLTQAIRANANLRSLVDLQDALVRQMCDAASRQEVKAGTQVVERGEYGGMFYIVESGSFQLRLDGGVGGGDALSRARSGALGAGRWASDSETQRRRQRKELFLQKLAYTQDLETGSPAGAARSQRRLKTIGADRSPGAEGADLDQDMRCCQSAAASPACRPTDSMSTVEPGPSCRESPIAEGDSPGAFPGLSRSPMREQSTGGARFADLSNDKEMRRFVANPKLLGGLKMAGEKSMGSRSSAERAQVIGFRRRAECFGELALLYHAPRTSTAIACEDSVVWCVSQAQFRRIMCSSQQAKMEHVVKKLGEVDLLQGLLHQEKAEVAQSFLTAKFKHGDVLIHEGEKQAAWYIITAGECAMTRRSTTEEGDGEEILATLTSPQHFGERALLRKRPSEFSVHVTSDEVECLVLDGPTFRELAGHLSAEDFQRAAEGDLLEFAKYKKAKSARNVTLGFLSRLDADAGGTGRVPRRSPSKDRQALPAVAAAEEVELDPAADNRALDRVGVLGRGAFGLVTLERDRDTQQLFALKTVLKRHVVENDLQGAICNERQILTMIDSPFIIRLYATFRDPSYLYFLFEPLLGGELHAKMCREPSRFRDVKVYRFLLGCVILALQHLHERNVVFRDLKTENILLDTSGYAKLCDMGFAKFVFGKTTTLCGTPEYMAPEVILHSGYDRMVDWWALGILTYEFVCGCTPFIDDEDDECGPEVIFANILSTREQELELPSRMAPATGDFIESLLQFSPGNRLGAGGASQIKRHQLFEALDFGALAQQSLEPSYVPKAKTEAELARTLKLKPVVAPCSDAVCDSRPSRRDSEGEAWDDIF